MPDAVRAIGGTRASCPCGRSSNETWPDTDDGLQGCRIAAWDHVDERRAG